MTPSQNNKDEIKMDYIGFDKDSLKRDEQKKAREKKRRAERKKSIKKRVLTVIGLSIPSLIVTFALAFVVMVAIGKSQMLRMNSASLNLSEIESVAAEDSGKIITYNGATYKINKNVTAILCMGIDRSTVTGVDSYGGNGQSDANFLLTIDTKSGRTCIIPINRDTMVDANVYSAKGSFAGTQKQQLCLAFANGDGGKKSCQNMMRSVSSLFYGIPVETYMAIDLEAIGVLNNAVGGVTVTAPESYIYREVVFKKGETVKLDSALKAEAFVRYRDINHFGSNVDRMNRQKQFLLAWSKAAIEKTKQNITFPVSLYNLAADYDINNLNISKISFLTSVVIGNGKNVNLEFKSVEGTLKQGEKYAEFSPDEQKLFELILDVFYDKQD